MTSAGCSCEDRCCSFQLQDGEQGEESFDEMLEEFQDIFNNLDENSGGELRCAGS